MEADRIKHLEFIQSVVTRMNSNSFQIKGWCITIVSALLALYAGKDENTYFIFIAIAPTILFWFLDAYYLQQERKFRKVYDGVIAGNVELFKMPINKYDVCYAEVFLSKTIAWLYGTIVFILFIGGMILKYKDCVTINC